MVRKKIRIGSIMFNPLRCKIILILGLTPLGELMRQKELAKMLKLPLTTLNYHILELKGYELLDRDLKLTDRGKKIFTKIKQDVYNHQKKFRIHKISIIYNIKRPPNEFDKLKNSVYSITNGKYQGFRYELLGCIICFYSKAKVVAYLPEIFVDSMDEVIPLALDNYVIPLKNNLEQIYDGLIIDDYKIGKIMFGHVAALNHPLAKVFDELNLTYESPTLGCDTSNGINELEAKGKTALENIEKINEYEKLIGSSNNSNTKNQGG